MSQSISIGNESIAVDNDQDDLKQLVGELVGVVEDQTERIDELSQRVEDLEDELADERQERTEADASDRRRITDVEARLEDVEAVAQPQGPSVEDGGPDGSPDEVTPIERLVHVDDDAIDSPSAQRAVALFRNLSSWGTRTPKGYVLKPADNPLRLLEADRNESLAWKQYYRAAESLERLSQGAVTFFDSDKHGKMLVLHEQSETYDRVRSGSLTTSSATETV